MREFALFNSPEKAFPQVVYDESGKAFDINADFRTVIKILDLYENKDILDALKFGRMTGWFYKGECPYINNALSLMFGFIAGHTRKTEDKGAIGKPDYDFTFDAGVIYSGFLKEYGVDLIEVPFLHWYKFRLMLAGLSGESAFKQRIEIRNMDTAGLKGKRMTKVRAAKEAVRIPDAVFVEDEEERKRLVELWG